jgi:glycosyltransferase involved in cell wall biosynthesis
MDLSVVLPIHDERENIRPLLDELVEVLEATGKSFEVIAVDDGSRDGSGALLRSLVAERPYLRLITFRRNNGQAAAFDAGFRHAAGDVVVTMDADLQNDPHDIPAMLAKLEDGFDVITGWRKKRMDGLVLRRVPSAIANRLIRGATGTEVHDLGCSLKVYRSDVTRELRLYGEMHRFISVLADHLGARVGEVVVNHRPRRAGKSKYGLARAVKVMLDLATILFLRRFLTKPIYLFGGLGSLMGIAGAFISVYVLWEKYDQGVWVHRNPLFLIAIVLFLMGVQFIGSGILAEILVRTYFESQDKTSYSIAAVTGFPPAEKPTQSLRPGADHAAAELPASRRVAASK